jgi:peptidoglycan/LPS O-acetylase OafA/YrhL
MPIHKAKTEKNRSEQFYGLDLAALRRLRSLIGQPQLHLSVRRRYMPGLDGLRALAVIGVILYHLGIPWAGGGLLGVSLFFVLSGYLITDLLCFEWSCSGSLDLKRFWLHRARRLLPAMLTTVVFLFLWTGLFRPQLFLTLKEDMPAALFYYSNWYYIFHHLSYFADFARPSLLTHFWSLAIEEQFYVVWPVALFFCFRSSKVRSRLFPITLIAAGVSALLMALLFHPGTDPSRVYYGTDTRAFSILIGAALAFSWPSWRLSTHLRLPHRIILDFAGFLAVSMIIFMMLHFQEYDAFVYRGGLVLFSVCAAVSIAAIAGPQTLTGRLFALAPLRWIGRRSYALYLWHYPLLMLATDNLVPGWTRIVLHVIALILTVVAADLSYKYIENPIRHGAVGHWWVKYRSELGESQRIKRQTTVAVVCLAALLAFLPAFISWTDARAAVAVPQIAEKASSHAPHPSKQTVAAKTERVESKSPRQSGAASRLHPDVISRPIDAIGDSIMIDIRPYLMKAMPKASVDGRVGRQPSEALPMIRQLKGSNRLSSTVIIELGTNGPMTSDQLRSIIDGIGTNRRVVLVNTRVPRPWQYTVNQTLAREAARYANVRLADWYKVSENHSDYFAPDQVHLTKSGAIALTNLLIKTVRE